MGFWDKLFGKKETLKKSKSNEEILAGWSVEEVYSFVDDQKRLAENGEIISIESLISIYKDGYRGVILPNKNMMIHYMKMAADHGDANWAYRVAMVMGPNNDECAKYMKIAADSGNADAQFNMHLLWRLNADKEKAQQANVYLVNAANAGYKDALDLLREYYAQAGMSAEEIERQMKNFAK